MKLEMTRNRYCIKISKQEMLLVRKIYLNASSCGCIYSSAGNLTLYC